MKTPKLTDEQAVEAYMEKLEHPLKAEIEAVRAIIKNAAPNISERIKWNAPSYYCKEDMVTFHIRPLEHVHLVFHHPAIVKIKSDLLLGDYKDRRMMYFKNRVEIEAHSAELQRILNELIQFIET